MGILNKKFEDDDSLPGSGVRVDLETKACPSCRREALPWQTRCEDCDEPVVRKDELPATGVDLPGLDALLAEDLDVEPDDPGDTEAGQSADRASDTGAGDEEAAPEAPDNNEPERG